MNITKCTFGFHQMEKVGSWKGTAHYNVGEIDAILILYKCSRCGYEKAHGETSTRKFALNLNWLKDEVKDLEETK
jgi:hypothetical protein